MVEVISPDQLISNRRIAFGTVALTGTNPTTVETGLDNIVAVAPLLNTSSAPGGATSALSWTSSGGTLNIYGWKPTATADTDLVASDGTETVSYVAFGS